MHPELAESRIFVLLSKRRRRRTVRILQESPTPLTVCELARRIADYERANPGAADFRAVYLSIYHNHLPKLEEAGVVVYDPGEGSVHPGTNFDALVRTLERVTEDDLPWSEG